MQRLLASGLVFLLILATQTGAAVPTPDPSAGDKPAVVLITGANRGIGLALTQAYAQAGWTVIATCRDPSRATDLEQLSGKYLNLHVEPLDVTSRESRDALAAKYRGQPIDVLINNAGTAGDYHGQRPGNFDDAAFLQVMRVNALAPLQVSDALLANVKASRQKKIVAISSGRGSVSKPFLDGRAYFYDMSKSALNIAMRKLQADLASSGVLVGIFAPGIVDTDLNHTLRNGVPPRRALITTEQSANGLVKLIGELSAENQARFVNYDAQVFEW